MTTFCFPNSAKSQEKLRLMLRSGLKATGIYRSLNLTGRLVRACPWVNYLFRLVCEKCSLTNHKLFEASHWQVNRVLLPHLHNYNRQAPQPKFHSNCFILGRFDFVSSDWHLDGCFLLKPHSERLRGFNIKSSENNFLVEDEDTKINRSFQSKCWKTDEHPHQDCFSPSGILIRWKISSAAVLVGAWSRLWNLWGQIGIGRRNFQILAASLFTGVETFSLVNLHLAHQTAVVVV